MAGKKKPARTPYAIKRSLAEVLKTNAEHPGRPLAITGNDTGRGDVKEVITYAHTKILSVKRNMVRIQQQADPIGFLIAAVNGDLMPVHYVEGDEVITEFHSVSLDDRLNVAKFLAGKILPTLSLTKHVMDEGGGGNATDNIGKPGGPSFAELVAAAAAKARGTGLFDDNEAIQEPESGPGEEGHHQGALDTDDAGDE